MYHTNNLNWTDTDFVINNYSNHQKNVIIVKSNYHVEITPQNTGADKY